MKKLCLCLGIVLLTACSNNIDKVEEKLGKLYNISNEYVVKKYNNGKITKMKANDMTFYVYETSVGNGTFSGTKFLYSSILSSVYEKHKEEIKTIAKKYNIEVKFNHTTDDYVDKEYFNNCKVCKGHFMTINIVDKEKKDVDNLVLEIIEIKEIKDLYNLWLTNSSNINAVYDFSYVDDNSEYTFQSLFKYYKNSSQED